MRIFKAAAITLLLALLPALAHAGNGIKADAEAEDTREYAFIHGAVNSQEWGVLTINESRKVRLTPETKVYDSREREISRNGIKEKMWVYAEGPIVNPEGLVEAEKVYLLPKRIDGKERRKYPFMKMP